MSEKIYCGNGKAFRFQNGGEKIALSVCLDDIPAEYKKVSKNGKTYVNLELFANRNGENQYGKTHYITVNTWKPEKQNTDQTTQRVQKTFQPPEAFESDQIPF
ncbi:MAG: hypothetical protein ACXQTR_01775 [Candidatus Methanospirareceae archaeon]